MTQTYFATSTTTSNTKERSPSKTVQSYTFQEKRGELSNSDIGDKGLTSR